MMRNTYTSQDVVRFVYKETTAKESMEMAEAMDNDWKLKEEYETLKQGMQELPKVTFSPSRNAIRNILGYSARTKLETC